MYGSECWQLSVRSRKKVVTVEVDFLKRSGRICMLEHVPKVYIRRRTGRIYITTERLETRQLVWDRHEMRMEEDQ